MKWKKKEETTPIEFLDIKTAIKMLPLIKSYSRDMKENIKILEILIKRNTKLDKIRNSTNNIRIEKIQTKTKEKIDKLMSKHKEWKEELSKLKLQICSSEKGIIDIPVYDPVSEQVIYFCIDKDSSMFKVDWHYLNQNYKDKKKYWSIEN